MKQMKQWEGFADGKWSSEIDVRDFIQKNGNPYEGDDSFLEGSTERTDKLMKQVEDLFRQEQEKGGVLDIDTETVSSLTAYKPGYVDQENELIVGFQTGAPLRRGVNPFGGINMARKACKAYGHVLSDKIEQEFQYRTTHNDGVFRVYTDEMKRVRHAGVVTGLPDAYGRGRIIGDYRRVALYGVDALIEAKEQDKRDLGEDIFDVDVIRASEEIYQQIQFLYKLKEMALSYGYDISEPASNTREAIQWTYFSYLASIKEQNGAAMSLGRVSTFFDIYIERDMKNGSLNEKEAQELVDHFVMKLRMARHLRTPDYNELFGGDPMWITESLGGMGLDQRTLVTKNTFRFLQTLYNLGPAPEPNLTVLWSRELPAGFKAFCAKVSIDTDSIQYENDDIMRPIYGDDYGIACCVSAMVIGKQMQFFGARCNLPKLLLLALNGGYDTTTKMQVGPEGKVIQDEVLDYETVMKEVHEYRKWICKIYINTLNVIHYMHDKYAYEKTQMALHDTNVERLMACGVAGLSVLTDSLSAIKHAEVKTIRDENGYIVDFKTTGNYPKYGNDDDRVDQIAVEFMHEMSQELRSHKTYRDAIHTLSVLTITSNVMYGKKTNNTPDGRRAGEPFAPGANPMHNREEEGALASLNTVAKLSYDDCQDGVSNTFSITPQTLGSEDGQRIKNLVQILDGYFDKKAQHINVNVLNPDMLKEAYDDPSKYPNLTIRVSGYAVNFQKLSRDQQREVLMRTFHEAM